MSARISQHRSRAALWARRLSVFFIQLLLLAALLHRFASLSTPAAINLFAVSFLGLFLAFCLAAYALIRIWYTGFLGAGQATLAVIVAIIGLAPLGWAGVQAVRLPMLTQVDTTPEQPVPIRKPEVRPEDANPLRPIDDRQAAIQREAYPQLQSLRLERSAPESFALVRDAMRRMGWEIVDMEPPVLGSVGYIQATAPTPILGFTDDVAVLVMGDSASAKVDVRSISRYGRHDLGTNAARVQALFDEVKEGIKKGERPVLEQVDPTPPLPSRKSQR